MASSQEISHEVVIGADAPIEAETPQAEVAHAEWLEGQCRSVPDVARGAIVVLDTTDEARPRYKVARWPRTDTGPLPRTLLNAAHTALRKHRPSWEAVPAVEGGESVTVIAFPVLDGGSSRGAVSLELTAGTKQRRPEIMQMLETGTQQLAKTLAAEELVKVPDAPVRRDAAWALRIMALVLDEEGFEESLMALIGALQVELRLQRVSFGRFKAGGVTLYRMANSTAVEMRSRTVRCIENAMEEAVEQDATLAYPLMKGRQYALRAHSLLARETDHEVCTVPLNHGDDPVGVLLLESRPQGATILDFELIEQIASLVTPVLHLKLRDERTLRERWRDAASEALVWVIGPRYPGLKLALAGFGLLLLVSANVVTSFEITAPAALEASVRRAVVAPVDGYVASASKRAGDLVVAGDSLAILDLRDLELEREKWKSELDGLDKEHRAAMADRDRATMRILKSRQDQVLTRMRMIEEVIARSHLVAPIDGVVITGDLSDAYGSPVQRGELLFEVAPLDDYRVVLKVDERDIAHVSPSQRGRIALAGLAAEPVAFQVLTVVPISEAADGRNYFKVEAELLSPSTAFRPGMSGIAKIAVDERSLLWVWTRRLIDWARLRLWEWG